MPVNGSGRANFEVYKNMFKANLLLPFAVAVLVTIAQLPVVSQVMFCNVPGHHEVQCRLGILNY